MVKIIAHKTDSDFYPISYGDGMAESYNLRIFSNYSLCYVVSGGAKYILNRKEFSCTSGDIYLVYPGMAVTLEPRQGTSQIYIEIGGSRATKLFERVGVTPDMPLIKNAPATLCHRFNEFADAAELTNPAADLTAQSLLYEFMAAIADALTRTTPIHIEKDKQWIEIQQFVNENYMNPQLTINDVANVGNLNPSYTSRKFKEYTGKSFSKYLIEIRLSHACTLIQEGVYSIKKVSELTGYSNQLYFSKEFKKEVGCTPKEYREKYGIKD